MLSTDFRKTIRNILYFAFMMILTLTIFGCEKPKPQNIKIGAILPLSGFAQEFGTSSKNAINLAAKIINETGGLHGKEIHIIYKDSQGFPEVGFLSFQELLNNENINYVIGGLYSSVTSSISKLALDTDVIVISPTASDTSLAEFKENLFRVLSSNIGNQIHPELTSDAYYNFLNLYDENYGYKPDLYAAYSFDALNILAEAIKNSNDDTKDIIDELYKTKNYQGATGTITFDLNGERIQF